jgi:catalase (peroxidase I)
MFRFRVLKPLVSRGIRSSHSYANQSIRSGAGTRRLAIGTAVASAVALTLLINQSESAGFFGWGSVDIDKVKKDISALIDADDEKRGNGTSIAPTLVRLAWHASGTYSAADKTGGSNGATMRFPPEATWVSSSCRLG